MRIILNFDFKHCKMQFNLQRIVL